MASNRASSRAGDWRTWSAAQWSDRLFDAIFVGDDLSRPVTSIPATPLDLRRAVGDASADPDEAFRAFARALAAPPSCVKELLSTDSHAHRKARLDPYGASAPGYFAYLVLTCYAAAGGAGETVSTAQFANRFRETLGHVVSEGYGYFTGLDGLWVSFGEWMSKRAAKGMARPFRLPPKDSYRTRIGRSVALAFPTLRDRQTMADLFSDLQGEQPGIREATRRVRNARSSFAEESRLIAEFNGFQTRLKAGDLDLRGHPFWTVVEDAVSLDYVSASQSKSLRLGLVMPEPGALGPERSVRLLCSPAATASVPGRFKVDVLDQPVGGFDGAVQSSTRDGAVSLLLGERLAHVWKRVGGTPLQRAAAQGLFLFERDEKGWPVTRHSLPEPGRTVWLLGREAVLTRVVLTAFKHLRWDDAPQLEPSLYDGWKWAGPLDASAFHGLGTAFHDVACLQPAPFGPALSLSGGVRVDSGGYLGDPAVRPGVQTRTAEAKARIASSVALVPVGKGDPIQLRHAADGIFVDVSGTHLVGDYVFEATGTEGQSLGRRRVTFVAGTVGTAYKTPTNPAGLTAEGAGVETVRWDLALGSLNDGAGFPYGLAPPPSPRTPRTDGLLVQGAVSTVGSDAPPDARWASLVEVVAAHACRRIGLGEGEFNALLTDVAGVPEGPAMWETARAWTEAGFVDLLTPAGWASRTYLACLPRLVTHDEGRSTTLVGLAPAVLREQFSTLARQAGWIERSAASSSPWVPPLPSYQGTCLESAHAVAKAAELPPPSALRPWTDVAAGLVGVALAAEAAPPQSHSPNGVWNWTFGGFGRPPSDVAEGEVSLVRYEHPRDVTWFVVQGGAQSRAFRSRTWAMLWALTLRGDSAFAYDADGRLASLGRTRAHLPVPLARMLACVAGAPGPVQDAEGEIRYVSPTTPEARQALSALWFERERPVPPEAQRLARRLLHDVRRSVSPGARVPPRLARLLDGFAHDSDVAAVSAARIPATLIPHVVRLASILNSL